MLAPSPSGPTASWPHDALYRRVIDALYAVPVHFTSRTAIEGIAATDLQTLNTVLGATIDDQVVATLNRMRAVWDPDENYQRFSFSGRPKCFQTSCSKPTTMARKSYWTLSNVLSGVSVVVTLGDWLESV